MVNILIFFRFIQKIYSRIIKDAKSLSTPLHPYYCILTVPLVFPQFDAIATPRPKHLLHPCIILPSQSPAPCRQGNGNAGPRHRGLPRSPIPCSRSPGRPFQAAAGLSVPSSAQPAISLKRSPP